MVPKKAPSSSSKTSQEGEAYKDLMREKKRILRLEAMILHEAKKKEAEYWHLMKMKLVAELTGESVDLSEIDMTAGPLLNGDLSQSISHGAHSTLFVLEDIYPQLKELHKQGMPWPFGIIKTLDR